jgi:Holliday junction DNA helicase RuvB
VKPQAFGVLLLDEIHRLSQSGQEDLLPVLEEGYFSTPSGSRIAVHWTTVIGATTEPEKVIKPLYDRFVHRPSLVDYDPSELALITKGMAAKLELDLPDDLCEQLGSATGGTPRNARSLVMAARDLQQIGRPVTFEAILDLAGMEKDGLNVSQVEYLRVLNGLGGKAGLTTMGAMMRLHPSVITDLERLLLKLRLIQYTAGGRELTNAGYEKANGAPTPIRRRRTA